MSIETMYPEFKKMLSHEQYTFIKDLIQNPTTPTDILLEIFTY